MNVQRNVTEILYWTAPLNGFHYVLHSWNSARLFTVGQVGKDLFLSLVKVAKEICADCRSVCERVPAVQLQPDGLAACTQTPVRAEC